MGFRFQKRVNLGDGIGVNVSKSGASPSLRTKYGSVGTRGFSVRTGIPGLTYKVGGKEFGQHKIKSIVMTVLCIAVALALKALHIKL